MISPTFAEFCNHYGYDLDCPEAKEDYKKYFYYQDFFRTLTEEKKENGE